MLPLASTRSERARAHRALSTASRVKILEVLRDAPEPMSAGEVADSVDLHVTTVRSHLDMLVAAGRAVRETEARDTRGRPRVLYRATAMRDSSEGGGQLAMILASHLAGTSEHPSEAAEAAGRAWGRFLVERPAPYQSPDFATALERVNTLLAEMGFVPEARTTRGGAVVDLHHCPFIDVAEAHPEVACSVHLGLLRGALEALDAPVEATAIAPFVGPSTCRATLRRTNIA
jgi:predicted ArsR family transcriptional regulator